jgi:hypothetical protein
LHCPQLVVVFRLTHCAGPTPDWWQHPWPGAHWIPHCPQSLVERRFEQRAGRILYGGQQISVSAQVLQHWPQS